MLFLLVILFLCSCSAKNTPKLKTVSFVSQKNELMNLIKKNKGHFETHLIKSKLHLTRYSNFNNKIIFHDPRLTQFVHIDAGVGSKINTLVGQKTSYSVIEYGNSDIELISMPLDDLHQYKIKKLSKVGRINQYLFFEDLDTLIFSDKHYQPYCVSYNKENCDTFYSLISTVLNNKREAQYLLSFAGSKTPGAVLLNFLHKDKRFEYELNLEKKSLKHVNTESLHFSTELVVNDIGIGLRRTPHKPLQKNKKAVVLHGGPYEPELLELSIIHSTLLEHGFETITFDYQLPFLTNGDRTDFKYDQYMSNLESSLSHFLASSKLNGDSDLFFVGNSFAGNIGLELAKRADIFKEVIISNPVLAPCDTMQHSLNNGLYVGSSTLVFEQSPTRCDNSIILNNSNKCPSLPTKLYFSSDDPIVPNKREHINLFTKCPNQQVEVIDSNQHIFDKNVWKSLIGKINSTL